MRVIICGAGIAGLTLACRLAEAGLDVLLVERAKRLRGEGYMIDLFGSGWDVAERMGLTAQLKAFRYKIPQVAWINRAGRTVANIDYDRVARLMDGRLMSLMRGDLEQILFNNLPHTVVAQFNRPVQTFRERGQFVEVEFEDGTTEWADLLIGADGVHSTIRHQLFGHESQFLRHLPYQSAAFTFEDRVIHDSLGGQFKLMATPGRQAGFYPLRFGRVAAFFAHVSSTILLPADPLEALSRIYSDLGWVIPAAIERAARRGVYCDNVIQVEAPNWSRGRVALVGDACQAVSLLAGQGAALAMAGAYILAEELERCSDIDEALRSYAARLQPAVAEKQATGRRTASWMIPSTSLQLATRNVAIGLANLPALSGLLGRMFLTGRESVFEQMIRPCERL
jgi:2-polyprenyl-6-methoxyphenol hydroxylase-like FAD-dependent oxidoreductase